MTTAVTKVQKVKSLITSDNFKKQLQMALPQMVTPERFMRVALTTVNKTPKLAECTQSSLFASMLDCASLGIEPDGRMAHLIPYGNTCQLIIDYKGLIELGRRSGEISDWKAVLVCDKDEFEADGEAVTLHHINYREPRGEVFAVYSVATFKDGIKSYEVMTRDEVDAIKKRSKAGRSGPWVTDWSEMAKKTVIRRHSKVLPMSAEFREAAEKDFDSFPDMADMASTLTAPQSRSEATEKDVTAEVEHIEEDDIDTTPPEQEQPVKNKADDVDEEEAVDWIKEAAKIEELAPAGPIKRARKQCNMTEDTELQTLPDKALQLYIKALKIEMGG